MAVRYLAYKGLTGASPRFIVIAWIDGELPRIEVGQTLKVAKARMDAQKESIDRVAALADERRGLDHSYGDET